jgi:hypothetical protein
MDEAYERRADELEREADHLQGASDTVAKHVSDAREDWDSKKSSNQAPGAMEPEDAWPGGFPDDEGDEGSEDGEDSNPEAPGGSG